MHQTRSRHVVSTADRTFTKLYIAIQGSLDVVKKTLADTQLATGIEFLCFEQTKDRSAETSSQPKDESEKEKVRARKKKDEQAAEAGIMQHPMILGLPVRLEWLGNR